MHDRDLRHIEVTPAASLTHHHLLAIINTELALRPRATSSGSIRILDAGCGDGQLLAYLSHALATCWPDIQFELFGFDVGDHGVQQPDYFSGTIEYLSRRVPAQRWADRLVLISERERWPYESAFFDIVVSNQVLEHVSDHNLFFSELARTLRVGGFSVHIFPLGHCVVEPHLGVPVAHWFSSSDMVAGLIRGCNRIGIGKFRSDQPKGVARDRELDRYVKRHTDYLIRFTNYMRQKDMLRYAKHSNLHASFRYTGRYYLEKIRSLLGKRALTAYPPIRGLGPAAFTLLLRYVASVTLITEKDESYSSLAASESDTCLGAPKQEHEKS